jgi:hypothetical protein
MKLTKILEQVISEIGDSTNLETYKTTWQKVNSASDDLIYLIKFTTGTEKNDNKYKVYLTLEKSDDIDDDKEERYIMTVLFGVEGENSIDYKSVVNNDKMYRVMATIVEIVKEMLDKLNNEGKYIKQILIDPSKNFEGDTRRARLYKAYIQKNMPQGSKLEIPDDMSYIEVTLPEQD